MRYSGKSGDADFLDRTVRRALGREISLSPRLPSLYEAPTETRADDAVDLLTPPHKAPITSPPGIANNIERHEQTSSPPLIAHRSQRMASVSQPAAENLPVASQNAIESIPSTAVQNESAQSVNFAIGALKPQPSKGEASQHIAPSNREPGAPPAQPAFDLEQHHAQSALDRAPRSVRLSEDTTLPANPIRIRERREELTPSALQPRPVAEVSAAQTISPAGSSPDPQPIIHVSIGRIEIRATSQPAPRPAPRTQVAQPMGLDEYLQKRGDGR